VRWPLSAATYETLIAFCLARGDRDLLPGSPAAAQSVLRVCAAQRL